MKPHLSSTQINMYLRCGEQYRRRYIEKEVLPPGIALIKGTAVHKSSEVNFRQKIDSHKDIKKSDALDIAASAFDGTVENEGVMLSEEERNQGKEIILGVAKDSTIRMTELMIERVAPKYQPVAVEEELKIPLESSPMDLNARLDLRTIQEDVVDLKTSSKTWTQDQADRSTQMTFYSMSYRSIVGKDPKKLIIENIVDKKKPDVVAIETSRTMDHYRLLIARANRVIDGIQKGVFTPVHEGSFWCSKRMCGFWSSCKVRPN